MGLGTPNLPIMGQHLPPQNVPGNPVMGQVTPIFLTMGLHHPQPPGPPSYEAGLSKVSHCGPDPPLKTPQSRGSTPPKFPTADQNHPRTSQLQGWTPQDFPL